MFLRANDNDQHPKRPHPGHGLARLPSPADLTRALKTVSALHEGAAPSGSVTFGAIYPDVLAEEILQALRRHDGEPDDDEDDWGEPVPADPRATTVDEAAARSRKIIAGLTPEHQHDVVARLIGELPYGGGEVAAFHMTHRILSSVSRGASRRTIIHIAGMSGLELIPE